MGVAVRIRDSFVKKKKKKKREREREKKKKKKKKKKSRLVLKSLYLCNKVLS